jgi:predicted DNA-binding WGR domain protein
MTTVILCRTDQVRNMARFYRLDIQTDLFGAACAVREWGRTGRVRSDPYPAKAEAQTTLQRQRQTKEQRGYASNSKVVREALRDWK